jgi:hypothetical protein
MISFPDDRLRYACRWKTGLVVAADYRDRKRDGPMQSFSHAFSVCLCFATAYAFTQGCGSSDEPGSGASGSGGTGAGRGGGAGSAGSGASAGTGTGGSAGGAGADAAGGSGATGGAGAAGGSGGSGGSGAAGGADGGSTCGATVCRTNQFCVHPSCGGALQPCTAAGDGGQCPSGWTFTPTCFRPGGTGPGCQPPPCIPPPPFCADLPASCPAVPTCGCFPRTICQQPGGPYGGECGLIMDRQVMCLSA